jgi:hypothetical protein
LGGVGAVVVFELLLIRVWPSLHDNDSAPNLEEQLAVVAALAVLALPHVIAVLGYRGRPWLLKVAGVVALTLGLAAAMTGTLGLLGIPLLVVPSLFYFVASARASGRGRVPTVVLALVAALCAGGAVVSLFGTAEEGCAVRIDRGGASTFVSCDLVGDARISGDPVLFHAGEIETSTIGDAVVFHESLPSLGLSAVAVAFCLWGSRRREGQPPAARPS